MGHFMNKTEQYCAFCETVRETVMQRMGNEFEVSVHAVVKYNNIKMDSLIIRKRNAVVMPSIYLNSFYDEFCNGRELDDIIKEILQLYETHHEDCQREISFSYEDIKDKFFFRIISKTKNEELLSTIPHIDVGSFALVFHCMMFCDEERMGTLRVAWEHCDMWGISLSTLTELTARSSLQLISPTLRPIEDVIEDILWDSLRRYAEESDQPATRDQVDELLRLLLHKQDQESIPMYVLSNQYGNYGASSLMAIPFLDDFHNALKEDFYILPSSVHEAILVPVSKSPGRQRLQEMVREINESQVPEQEFLSDDVYLYSEFRNELPPEILNTMHSYHLNENGGPTKSFFA